MAIFTLFATFTSAYAWFMSIMNQDADHDEFYIKRVDTSVTAISIHEYYGTTADGSSFTFNPTGISILENGEFHNDTPVELNEYSLENPNHPVLILFKNKDTSGLQADINLVTEYAFLGANDSYINHKVKTKAALDAMVTGGELTDGDYCQVTSDEGLGGRINLYKYSNGVLTSVTYDSFDDLEDQVSKEASNNQNYYRVHDDENRSHVSTVYQYNHALREFEMVWCDLGNADYSQTNPLSSAVEFHYFTFDEEISGMVSTEDVMVESFNSTTATYSYEEESLSCIAVNKSGFTDSNKSSFSNFSNAETFVNFNKEINVFHGDITGVKYIGIVVNYNQLALEYIFSHNLGHEALNAGLDFKCDWKTVF